MKIAIVVMVGAAIAMTASSCSSSTSPPPSTAVRKVAATVADGLCSVLETESSAEWVSLVCAAEGAASSVIIRMPRAQWSAIRARTLDAGPGK